MRRKLFFFSLILLVFALVPAASAQEEESFPLTIMHTNDTHAAHAPNGDGNGGVAIQAAVVKQIRAEAENSLLLDAGDRFTGTLYHTVYEGQDQVPIMNALGYDAMTLGNHEFDKGDEVLANFLKGLAFPAVNANIDFSASPWLADAVQPYAVLDVNGEKVGIIGLTTADTPNISSPGDELVWRDDYAAVVAEQVAALNAEGVNKIILVTHTGINVDLNLLAELPGVDIVVGGHSHTLFSSSYTGAFDEYPVQAETSAGEPILYVQAAYSNVYLGRLDVEFDANGVLTTWEGDTILLSRYITPDPELAEIVDELSGPVTALQEQATGAATDVLLVGDRAVCRVQECNLGNLIADAMLAETGAQIAIMNGGGIRASIEPGDISYGEVLTVQPFGNTISTFEISGADIVAALENGVSGITVDNGLVVRDGAPGRFPQVAGLRFTFNPTLDAGSRVLSVEVKQADGSYAPIDPAATYSVVTNNFVRTGGDGYVMFAENAINPYDFGRIDFEATLDFLVANSPINYAAEGRITLEGAEYPE